MIKVLHLIWRIDGGGIEQFCLNLLKYMDSVEYNFDFAVCGEKNKGEEATILNDSKIYHLPLIQGVAGKKNYLNELRKILQDNDYNVVHSHLAFMNISTLKVAQECGVAVRISHTHVAGSSDIKSLKNRIKRQLMNTYATKCFACSDKVLIMV